MFTLKQINSGSSRLLSELSIQTFVQAYEDVHSQGDLDVYCRDNYSVNSAKSLLESTDTEAIVAFENSAPAGFYVIRHRDCPIELDGSSSELKQLYVLSGYYGSGLGRKLFDSAIDRARKQQSKWLWLYVSDINFRAQAFYKKIGFLKVGQGPKLIVGSDTLSSSIMALSIGMANAE